MKKLLLVLILALLLLSAAAWQKSFWEDEAWTAENVQGGIGEVIEVSMQDFHPPLFLTLLSLWGKIFGYQEIGLRSFSIFWALVSVALTYGLARILLNPQAALIAALLLAISPLFVLFAPNARYYSFGMALSLSTILSFVNYLKDGKLRWLLIYILAGLMLIYLIYAAAVVLLACNLWWFIEWWRSGHRWKQLLIWLGAQLILVIGFLPWIDILANQTLERGGQILLPGIGLILELGKRLAYAGFAYSLGETLSPLNWIAWVGLGIVVMLLIAAVVNLRREKDFWLIPFFLIIILSANLLLTLNDTVGRTWQNLPYRALYALPLLIIWIAAGLNSLAKRYRLVLGLGLIAVYSVGIWNFFTHKEFIQPAFDVPWREIMTEVKQEKSPNAIAICNYGDYACFYYANRELGNALTPPEWLSVSNRGAEEVWWFQTNRSEPTGNETLEKQALDTLKSNFSQTQELNFAPQDATIRELKKLVFSRDDYEFRVTVFRFHP